MKRATKAIGVCVVFGVVAFLSQAQPAGAAHATAADTGTSSSPPASPELGFLEGKLGLTESQANAYLTAGNRLAALMGQMRADFPGTFGGVWLEATSPPRVAVAVTDGGVGLKGLAAQAGLPVDVLQVKFDEAALQSEMQRLNTLGQRGRVDIQHNQIVLELPPGGAFSDAVAKEVASVKDMVATQPEYVTSTATSRSTFASNTVMHASTPSGECDPVDYACWPPLRGGAVIFDNSNCTSGFVTKDSTGTYYLVTAGHCFNVNIIFKTYFPDATVSTHNIGPAHRSVLDSNQLDAGTIGPFYNPSGWQLSSPGRIAVYNNAYSGRNYLYSIVGAKASVVGDVVCTSGIGSGGGCGFITATGGGLYLINVASGGSYYLNNPGQMSFCPIPGDSGGPAYSSGRALGIVSARRSVVNQSGQEISCGGYYSGITASLQALSVSLL